MVLFVSASSGFDLLYRMVFILLAILAVAFLWAQLSLRGLSVTRKAHGTRSQVGKTLQENISVTSHGFLPKPWVELRDRSDLPDHRVSAVVSLPGNANLNWAIKTRCRRRGRYRLGPLELASGDPFGLFHKRLRVPETIPVLIYPQVIPLPDLNIPSGDLPGGTASRHRSYSATPSVSGVREYVSGDSMSRIHWLSTARRRELMVKEFERDPTSDVWIVLDMEARAQWGVGDDSTEEWAVKAAASLADHFLRQNRAVGVVIGGLSRLVLTSDRGTRQLVRILEELAVAKANGTVPVAEVLAAEGIRFSRGDTVLVVTPSLDETWLKSAQLLLERGTRAVAVLVEPGTFGNPESSVLLVGLLVASQVPTFLVKKGEPLEHCLAGDGLDLTSKQKFVAVTG